MKRAHLSLLASLAFLLSSNTVNASSWLQWCCGRRRKPIAEKDLRTEMILRCTMLQEQHNKAIEQLRSETQQQNETQQQINTLLDEYQNKIEQRVQTLLSEHQEGQTSTQPNGRLSGNVRAIAQTPRFTKSDIIGELPTKLALLFAACKAHQSPSNSPQLPRGVLFEGPPGTGKTFMAEALAGEAQFLYFYQSAPGMHGEYANDGIIYVREYFADVLQQAQEADKPAIVVIDELDGVGLNRDSLGQDSAGSSKQNTLLQLMTELTKPRDTNQQPVIVIGTTNCIQRLDPALKRKQRFNKTIRFQLPNSQQYLQAMKHYKNKYERCKKSPGNPVSIEHFIIHKFSLADIDCLFEEADLRAWAADAEIATPEHYQQALDSLIEEKQLETSRGLKYERDELLKDLPLIQMLHTGFDGVMSNRGIGTLERRLAAIVPQKEQLKKLYGLD